jgi:cytoskeletal protein RodZ
METLGKTLKALREEKGMTVKDVYRKTKIREPLIIALEAEEWEKLPEKIFVRGFVKSFVQAVGGDQSLILDLFESACPGGDSDDGKMVFPAYQRKEFKGLGRRPRNFPWIITSLIFLMLIIGGAVYYFFGGTNEEMQMEKTSEFKSTSPTATEPSSTENDTGNAQNDEVKTPEKSEETTFEKQIHTTRNSQKKSSPQTDSTEMRNKTSEAEAHTEKNTSKSSGTTGQPATKKVKKEGPSGDIAKKTTSPVETRENLIIKAKKETWISLKIDGKIHKEMLLKAGERFEIRIKKTADLLIGNAGGVDIEFNGKTLNPVGKPGQVVHLKLLSKKD